jgi:hypothetical protein
VGCQACGRPQYGRHWPARRFASRRPPQGVFHVVFVVSPRRAPWRARRCVCDKWERRPFHVDMTAEGAPCRPHLPPQLPSPVGRERGGARAVSGATKAVATLLRSRASRDSGLG